MNTNPLAIRRLIGPEVDENIEYLSRVTPKRLCFRVRLDLIVHAANGAGARVGNSRYLTYLDLNTERSKHVKIDDAPEFARDLAQTMAVMDRGSIVLAGARDELDEADVRRRLSV